MHSKLSRALSLVRGKYGASWYREPISHDRPGFYKAKEFLRGYLGSVVIIHGGGSGVEPQMLHALIDGDMHSVSIG